MRPRFVVESWPTATQANTEAQVPRYDVSRALPTSPLRSVLIHERAHTARRRRVKGLR